MIIRGALMVLANGSPTVAGEVEAFCPCYTTGMIDAALVTLNVAPVAGP